MNEIKQQIIELNNKLNQIQQQINSILTTQFTNGVRIHNIEIDLDYHFGIKPWEPDESSSIYNDE
jgi:hypothetical protein